MLQEIILKRTERNKIFDLGSGKCRLVCHGKPIHYQPKDKTNWEDINLDFREETDKFITDENKVSVGFRKDLQFYKYFGVRYDEEHQFEGTIKEIKLNNIEQAIGDKVSSLQKNSRVEISHRLNSDVEIINKINEISLINFVKVNNPIEDFKIVEELHLKGLTCSNKKKGIQYIPDEHNKFNFVDEKGELKFWINQPFFKDNIGEHFQSIKHTLQEINGHLIYIKTPTKEGQDDLVLAQYPILIDTNTYYGTGIDCVCLSGSQTDWDTAHDLTTANSSDHHNATDNVYTAHSSKDGSCEINRAFMKFDTSNLPDAATITAAVLKLYGIGTHTAEVSVQEGTTTFDYGTQSYNEFTGSFFAHTTLANSQYNSLTFNAAGKANINKTGNTEYCIREYDHDYLDVDPGSGNSYFSGFYFDDETGETKDPKLEIDYTEGATFIPKAIFFTFLLASLLTLFL